MDGWKSLVRKHRKGQRSALADSLAAGAAFAGESAGDLHLTDGSGTLWGLPPGAGFGLPFVLIAFSEGRRVLLRHKTGTAGLQDLASRALRAGLSLSAGAAAASLGAGPLAAIPAAMGARLLLERYRSRLLTGRRVRGRIRRLKALEKARLERLGPVSAQGGAVPFLP